MIRILIADDHPVLRKGLKELLLDGFEDLMIGEAGNAHEVLSEVRTRAWDLVILDITMPGRSGLDVLRDIKQLGPKPPVLVLSMHPENYFAKRVLKSGAAGYLNKEAAPVHLIAAVQKALSGGRYVSAALAEDLALDLTSETTRLPHERLSDREFEILRMIALGKTNSQIAKDLHLSATTVSTHRARILAKMDMASNAELMRYAMRNGLID
jgi:two-component system invasion response regulator UvrY